MGRWVWRLVAAVLGAPLLWLLAALAIGAIGGGGRQHDAGGIAVWVISNGYHAGLVLPVAAAGIDWRDDFPAEHFPTEIRGYPMVAFGWGEREVYMNTPRFQDLNLLDGLRAVLALSSSVAHVQYGFAPYEGEHARRLTLSPERYRALAAHVRAAFRSDADGRPIVIAGRGFAASDAFYEGTGRYSFIYTCNQWVGEGLRRIGAPVAPWTPLAPQVLAQLK